jgi:hypothetical protein
LHCKSCQYDLRKLTEHRCPECARFFDPEDSNTFTQVYEEPDAWMGRAVRVVLTLWFLFFVFMTLHFTQWLGYL